MVGVAHNLSGTKIRALIIFIQSARQHVLYIFPLIFLIGIKRNSICNLDITVVSFCVSSVFCTWLRGGVQQCSGAVDAIVILNEVMGR